MTENQTSGTAILALMAVMTVVLTALIAGYCVLEAWWLLPLIVLALLASAIGVVGYFFHVMADDDSELAPH